MTYDEKLKAIFEKIGCKAVLEQTIEECAELTQASAKQLRIFRGVNYTPIKLSDNSNNLLEEMADVYLCLDVMVVSFSKDKEQTRKRIEAIKQAKLERWLSRLDINEVDNGTAQ